MEWNEQIKKAEEEIEERIQKLIELCIEITKLKEYIKKTKQIQDTRRRREIEKKK